MKACYHLYVQKWILWIIHWTISYCQCLTFLLKVISYRLSEQLITILVFNIKPSIEFLEGTWSCQQPDFNQVIDFWLLSVNGRSSCSQNVEVLVICYSSDRKLSPNFGLLKRHPWGTSMDMLYEHWWAISEGSGSELNTERCHSAVLGSWVIAFTQHGH